MSTLRVALLVWFLLGALASWDLFRKSTYHLNGATEIFAHIFSSLVVGMAFGPVYVANMVIGYFDPRGDKK